MVGQRAFRTSFWVQVAALLFITSAPAAESSLESWISAQTDRSLDRVYEAISPSDGTPGAVMASPSRSNPDYYAHWVRDAALTMREVWAYRALDPKGSMNAMTDYALLAQKLQAQRNWSSDMSNYNPAGAPVENTGDLGIGEPKFLMDGSPYARSWGRPQNDGPALRVLSLLDFADELLLTNQGDWVRNHLYRPELPARTVIKADLEFLAHHWYDPSFDLWEERLGDHFYTRIAQWRALDEGATFAERMGDPDAAAFYRQQGAACLESLNKFWSASNRYLVATLNSTKVRLHGGPKPSNLDIAVVLGVLHAGRSGSPFYVDDDRVIATAHELEGTFDYAYAINRVRQNEEDQLMGPAIGRYSEDTYDGQDHAEGDVTQGNPWFLTTHAMAEYYLRLRGEIKNAGELRITDLSRPFFEDLVKTDFSTQGRLRAGDPSYDAVLKALQERSDAYIRRSKFHTGEGGHQSEQINRVHGSMQGARDLTWSYASFLSLRRYREIFHD